MMAIGITSWRSATPPTNQFGTALYVDGVRHGVNATKPVLTANAARLMIGENPEARAREWEGEIDDIAIWNRVLTPAEITTLYNGGTGTPLSAIPSVAQNTIPNRLVAYWNFDGNLLDSIKDFDGTARGTTPVAFVDGKAGFGKAIKLDGTDQFVEITGGDENELEFPGGSMSIAGWFKVDAFDTDWQALIAKGEGSNYRVARRAATAQSPTRVAWARVPLTFPTLMMANGITSWRSATPQLISLAPPSMSMESGTGSMRPNLCSPRTPPACSSARIRKRAPASGRAKSMTSPSGTGCSRRRKSPTLYNGGTGTPLSALLGEPPPSTEIVITSVDVIGNSIAISWEGGEGPFLVQGAAAVTGPWVDLVTTTESTTSQLTVIPTAFFRIIGKTTKSILQFSAVLSGAAERPNPVTTTAAGLASVSLDGDKVTTILSFAGLSGPPSAGHFHGPATAEQAAGVMVGFPAGTLPSATSGALIFELTFDAAQKTALTGGMTYLNLHTAANGGGEIRGQVVLPAAFRATLTGAAERPNPVTTTATGTALLSLLGNQLTYHITFDGLSGPATAGHIHGPAGADAAAGVLIGFPNVPAAAAGTFSGVLTLTDAQLNNVLTGQTYVNIHTAANGGGEIRGQVLP